MRQEGCSQSLRRVWPADILISHYWPPELGGQISVKMPSWWYFVTAATGNPYQGEEHSRQSTQVAQVPLDECCWAEQRSREEAGGGGASDGPGLGLTPSHRVRGPRQ